MEIVTLVFQDAKPKIQVVSQDPNPVVHIVELRLSAFYLQGQMEAHNVTLILVQQEPAEIRFVQTIQPLNLIPNVNHF